jgi:hypothetical protein
VSTFVAVYLLVGFVLGAGLFAWAFSASVRRHGLSGAMRNAVHAYWHELPLYWRVPWAAGTFLIFAPVIVFVSAVRGDFSAAGTIALGILWLLYLRLLLWHRSAKKRQPPKR